MFRECYERLSDRFLIANEDCDSNGSDDGKISYLSSIIDCFRLREARESSDRRSKLCDSICRPIARDDPGKVNAGRRIGKVFSKNGTSQFSKRGEGRFFSDSDSKPWKESHVKFTKKRTRAQDGSRFSLMTVQNVKRGKNGGIIPAKSTGNARLPRTLPTTST